MTDDAVLGYVETPKGKILLRRRAGLLAWDAQKPELVALANRLVDLSADIAKPDGNPYAAAIHKLNAYLPGFSRVLWQPPEPPPERPKPPAAHETYQVLGDTIRRWTAINGTPRMVYEAWEPDA